MLNYSQEIRLNCDKNFNYEFLKKIHWTCNRCSCTFIFLASCSDSSSSVDAKSQLTQEQEAAISYFSEIAFGFEFGNASEVTRRWEQDMRVFVGGMTTEYAPIDKQIIQLLYHPEMSTGLNKVQAQNVLIGIIEEVVPS